MHEKILVVDDQPVNVQLLKRKLEREGMHVMAATSGQEALDVLSREHPDLILLDVMMPEMDGIEACRRLQANEETRAIPVIFVTARAARENKIEGLSVGAVDYITKPVDLDEMMARVRTQLRLVAVNREMVDLQRRLFESRRTATIGAVTQGIAHNLNNMLAIVLGYVDLIKIQSNKPEQIKNNATGIEKAVKRIAGVIRQLNQLVVQTMPPTSRVPLQKLLEDSVERYHATGANKMPVTINNPLGNFLVEVHIESFEDISGKLLANAQESYGARNEGATIEIDTAAAKLGNNMEAFEIRIADRGCGIDPKIRDHMFEPFVSAKQTVGVGMGLTIARHTLRTLGGELMLHDRPGGGTVAVMTCPVEQVKLQPKTQP